MTEQEWDDLCDGCGLCCRLGGTQVACPSLDTCSNQCTNYENRTKTEVCVKVTPSNIAALHRAQILPKTCGYVRWYFGIQPYRLDFMKGAAKLIPFAMAKPEIQNSYLEGRKVWFAKQERDND